LASGGECISKVSPLVLKPPQHLPLIIGETIIGRTELSDKLNVVMSVWSLLYYAGVSSIIIVTAYIKKPVTGITPSMAG
jgi:hypothetical protein